MTTLLEVNGVQSGYGKVPVLHGVSIRVEEGEIVAVLGANGAGKTTLMKTITGILPTVKGDILFKEQSIRGFLPNKITMRGLGYMPQGRNIFPDLTVRENLEMGAFLLANSKSDVFTEVFELFPLLQERENQNAGTLSGGERQMLAMACASITKPSLLILDEPTSGLSPQATVTLINKIYETNSRGTSILWVIEENPRQILDNVGRVYLLDSGVIKKEDTGKGFLDDPNFEQLFLGTSRT